MKNGDKFGDILFLLSHLFLAFPIARIGLEVSIKIRRVQLKIRTDSQDLLANFARTSRLL